MFSDYICFSANQKSYTLFQYHLYWSTMHFTSTLSVVLNEFYLKSHKKLSLKFISHFIFFQHNIFLIYSYWGITKCCKFRNVVCKSYSSVVICVVHTHACTCIHMLPCNQYSREDIEQVRVASFFCKRPGGLASF
jgi:hypothetical protein